MTDREKVVKGLECCAHEEIGDCDNCPYNENTPHCDIAMMRDAIAMLKAIDVTPEEMERLKKCRHECKIDCLLEKYEQALAKAKGYDHLLHLAKAMHLWIFMHAIDEQEVYDELGFTDEDNALLGSIGRPMVIGTVKRGDSDGDFYCAAGERKEDAG